MMMEVCQEMMEAGYQFTVDELGGEEVDSFCIEDGRIKPIIATHHSQD